MRAVGVMSGTSCDGVDAVLLELEGPDVRAEPDVLCHAFVPYDDALREELSRPAELSVARVAELGSVLPRLYAEAVRRLDGWERAEVVGCHGQTVWHAPPSRGASVPCTLQLGSPSVLAALLGRTVVSDLRAADLALGGEGAPIVPIAHHYFTPERAAGRMIANVGGIANVTHVGRTVEELWASDVGPGMMIVDALAREASAGALAYDRDGALARSGTARPEVVDHVLAHPFFVRPGPRTTGREDFGVAFTSALRERFAGRPMPDLARSAVAATAECIWRAAARRRATELLLTGGGAKHPVLADELRRLAGALPVRVATEGVLAPSHHEPAAMAFIAARTLAGLPSSVPRVTGASRAAILGVVASPP